MNRNLYDYLNSNILPKYEHNIGGHDIEHIKYVISRSKEIVDELPKWINN